MVVKVGDCVRVKPTANVDVEFLGRVGRVVSESRFHANHFIVRVASAKCGEEEIPTPIAARYLEVR